MKGIPKLSPLLLITLLHATDLFAGKPEVVDVKVTCPIKNYCNFSVTVRHTDKGWDHYTDRWEVLGPDNKVLGTRTLWHPHVHEQPFTRLLEKVAIPANIHRVTIRAHDSVHGYGEKEIEVLLPSH
jgi:hypothetical protein